METDATSSAKLSRARMRYPQKRYKARKISGGAKRTYGYKQLWGSNLSSNYHYHIRCAGTQDMVTSTSAEAAYGYAFALANVDNHTELTNLYDYFRIVKVEWLMFPHQGINVQTGATASSNTGIYFGYYVDYDDASAPTMNDMRQRAITNWCTMGERLTITVYPRPIISTSTDAQPQNIIANRKQWLDVAAANTVHFGLKFCFGQASVVGSYRCVPRYHLIMRATR